MENVETVYIEGEFLDGDLLKTSVFADGFEKEILGISFNLKYDQSALKFIKYEPGEFLEQGGDPFYLVSDDEQAGKIVFGETLRRDDQFPSGAGKVADFYWQITSNGEFPFSFEKGVVSTLDTVRQDLQNINFENVVLNREREEMLILNGNDQVAVFNAEKGKSIFDSTDIFYWLSLGMFLLIIGLLLGKKFGSKRTSASVNFK